jgi:hypothetical protein
MRKFMLGVICGCLIAGIGTAIAQVYTKVDTNGVLKGYTVQKNGKTVCKDPDVWNDFRGQGSFIVCP